MAAKVTYKRLVEKLEAQSPSGRKAMELQVGYAAKYAIFVHENLAAIHKVGQAKFLEEPARRLRKAMEYTVYVAVKNKDGLEVALTRAGNLLLEESKPLVPVDTGYLRDSGYVRIKDK